MNSKKQKPRPKREKIEDSENQQIEQSGTGTKAPKADAAYSTIYSTLIAILAALLEPEVLKGQGGRGPAIRGAEKIVRAVPQYLAGKDLSLEEKLERFRPELDLLNQEAAEWGFPEPITSSFLNHVKKHRPKEVPLAEYFKQRLPQGVMTFEEASENEAFKDHKSVSGLTKFMRKFGYPKPYLQMGLITPAGYQRALEKRKQERQEKNTRRKRESRQKQSLQGRKKSKTVRGQNLQIRGSSPRIFGTV